MNNNSRLYWALPRSLAATKGIDVSFFSSGYLDVSVRRVPSACLMVLGMRYLVFYQVSSLIRIPTSHRICAPKRGFSQLVASFFGSQCLGIRLMLFGS